MARTLWIVLLLLLVIPPYIWLYEKHWQQRAEMRQSAQAGYVLPSKFSRVLALEYDGLLADFQFLKLVTFIGERVLQQEKMSEKDWDYVAAALESITHLDPYFLDPYLLGESLLTWEAGRIEEANQLLEKGMRHREGDWQMPFFIGFNYFYFLKDYERGAEYLMQASKLPGSPAFLPNLAARLGYYGKKTKTAVVFLKSIHAQTSDPKVRHYMEARITALERAALIEERVDEFVADRGHPPAALEKLVQAGYLERLPEDPYGGEWILMENGRVFSTSRFVEGGANKPAKSD